MTTAQLFKAFGEEKTIMDWAKDPRCEVSAGTLRIRIKKGMTLEEAISQPKLPLWEAFGECKTWTEWWSDPRRIVENERTVRSRLDAGWSFEDAITKKVGQERQLYQAFNESKTVTEWADDERCVVGFSTLWSRLQKGWEFSRALTEKSEGVTEYTFDSETKSLSKWSIDDRCVVAWNVLRRRVEDEKWDLKKALTTPVLIEFEAFGETKCLEHWIKDERCLVSWQTVRYRVNNLGLQPGDNIETVLTDPIKDLTITTHDAFGESKTLTEWSLDERCVHNNRDLLSSRLYIGWDIEKAIQEDYVTRDAKTYKAFNKDLSLYRWVNEPECVVQHPVTIYSRIQGNMPVEEALTREVGMSSSYPEQMLANYIESLGFDIVRNDRTVIPPKELDIFIPEKNVAIEFNGLYWHSEKFNHKNYHYNKYISCEAKNVRLIQIWEDDWNFKQDIVCKMLAQKLGVLSQQSVYARKCKIDSSVGVNEAKQFLNENHIQGWTTSSYYYGLRFEGLLVALVCMKKVDDKNAVWDLVRFATSANVPGGFSKLLKAFRKDHDGAIKTFADLTLSDGGLYYQTGFVMDKFISPDYFYVETGNPIRSHKFSYRKKRFKNDPELFYDESMTEGELAAANGLLKIYDAGKLRFVLK